MVVLQYIIPMLLAVVVSCTSTSVLVQHEYSNKIASEFLKLFPTKITVNTILDMVINVDVDSVWCNYVLKGLESNYKVHVSNDVPSENLNEYGDYTVLIINRTYPAEWISQLKTSHFLTFQTKHLLVLLNPIPNVKYLDRYPRRLLQQGIVVCQFEGSENVQKLTFDYGRDAKMRNLTELSSLDDLYYGPHKNLHNHIIQIDNAQWAPYQFEFGGKLRGISGRMFEAICLKLNTTYKLIPMETTSNIIEEVWINLMGGFTDLSVIPMKRNYFDLNYQSNGFQMSYTKKIERYVILVPKIKKPASFLETFKSFKLSTLLTLVLTTIVLSIIWYIYRVWQHQKPSINEMIFDYIKLPVMQALSQSHNTYFERIIVISLWLIACIFCYRYQSFMITDFITPTYFQAPTLIEWLNETNRSVVSFIGDGGIYFPVEIANKSIFEIIPNVTIEKKSILIEESVAKEFLTSEQNHRGKQHLYEQLDGYIDTVHYSYVMTFRVPMSYKFHQILDQIFEAGLETYWKIVTEHDMFRAKLRFAKPKHTENDEILNSTDFWNIAGFVLIYGWIISLCGFILEIIYAKFIEN